MTPRRGRSRALFALLAMGPLGGCGAAAAPDLVVAAAASLRPLLEAALPAAAGLPARTACSYGASANLVAQIRRGAPFALLLAADEHSVATLVADGIVPASDTFEFARGRLMLWCQRDLGAATDGLRALEHDAGAIAIADPEVAPYGRAAIEALTATGLLTGLRPRLLLAENAAQAAHFARSGAVVAALLPRSQAEAPALRDHGHRWLVPTELHAPIRHAGAVLARDGPARAGALALRDLLRSEAGRALLVAHGFEPVE